MSEKNKSKTEKEKSHRAVTMKEVSVEVLSRQGKKPITHFTVETQGGGIIHANGRSIVSLGEFSPSASLQITIRPERGYNIQFNEQTRQYIVRMRNNTVTFNVSSRVVRATVEPPRRSQADIAAADAWQAQIVAHHRLENITPEFEYTSSRQLHARLSVLNELPPPPTYIQISNRAGRRRKIIVAFRGDRIRYITPTSLTTYQIHPFIPLRNFCNYVCPSQGVGSHLQVPTNQLPAALRANAARRQ